MKLKDYDDKLLMVLLKTEYSSTNICNAIQSEDVMRNGVRNMLKMQLNSLFSYNLNQELMLVQAVHRHSTLLMLLPCHAHTQVLHHLHKPYIIRNRIELTERCLRYPATWHIQSISALFSLTIRGRRGGL